MNVGKRVDSEFHEALDREKGIQEGVIDSKKEFDQLNSKSVQYKALKRDADAELILNQLYQFSPLQKTASIIMLALVDGRPRTLTLKQLAKRTGLSVSLLSQIERAESSASVTSLYKIAHALKIRLTELFARV